MDVSFEPVCQRRLLLLGLFAAIVRTEQCDKQAGAGKKGVSHKPPAIGEGDRTGLLLTQPPCQPMARVLFSDVEPLAVCGWYSSSTQ